MVFDDTEPVFDESRFQRCDWSEYYPARVKLNRRMHPKFGDNRYQ
jgi:hypothetical protein